MLAYTVKLAEVLVGGVQIGQGTSMLGDLRCGSPSSLRHKTMTLASRTISAKRGLPQLDDSAYRFNPGRTHHSKIHPS